MVQTQSPLAPTLRDLARRSPLALLRDPYAHLLRQLPPGPGLPPAVQLARWVLGPLPFLREQTARFGDVFTVKFPRLPPLVVVAHPEAIRDVFTGDPDIFHAGKANIVLEPVMGTQSLLLLDGPRHLAERRLMMPPFHGERMQAYIDTMRDAALHTLSTWPARGTVGVHAAMQDITLDVILRAVFGMDDADTHARFRALLTRLLEQGANPVTLIPWLRVDVGTLSPWGRLRKLLSEVDDALYAELRARRARPGAGRTDVLQLLLDARDEHGEGMTDPQLRDELITLLLAGHETTATSLSWTLHRLSLDPAAQAAARAEVERVTQGGPVRAAHLGELEYIEGCVRESLRLHPVVPFVGRVLQRPARIAGIDLPAGVVVAPSVWLAHHRAEDWPDPERFDPARHAGTKSRPYTFLPFGGGVRRCVGLAFAMVEMKVVLATIVSHFQLRPVLGHRTRTVRRSITLAPSGGMPLDVERLSSP